MADQNVTTTKAQEFAKLRAEEMLPDSDCLEIVAGYAAALSDAMNSLDLDTLQSETHSILKNVQYHLNMRVFDLIAIEKQRGAA